MSNGPNWLTIENAIWTWVTTEIGMNAIWKHQNAPQIARPYIVLHIDNIQKIGFGDIEGHADASTGARALYGTREFSVSVSVFGTHTELPDRATVHTDATIQLTETLQTLFQKDIQATLRAAGAIFIDFDDVIDTSFVEDDHHAERADSMIHFRTSTEHNYGGNSETQIIETVAPAIGYFHDGISNDPITITLDTITSL
jgi:hypothetical protein